ncbi:MAG: PAS domain S-box protein [Dehalococcoidia bacterium]
MARKPLGKEKFKAPLKGTPKNIRPPSSSRLYLVMALVAVVILVGGYLFYYFQEQQMLRRFESGLSTVAQLKAEQIAEWRYERLVDANVLAGSPFFTEGVAEFMASPTDTEIRDKILAKFAIIEKAYPYQDILLTDVNGSVLLRLNDSVPSLSDMTLTQLAVAIKEHKAVMTDFNYPPGSDSPQLNVIAPLFPWGQDSQQALGAVVFCIDPSQYLWPMLQSSPMPSETAETFLVERDGDQVLFLSDLRYQKDAALKLRVPLSQPEVLAVMAVLGKEGVVEGKDYRGVKVLAALKHVPDSPWYMVAEIDTSEALSVWRLRSGMIIASVAGLLAAALAVIGLIWQRRQRLAYQALYQAEIGAQALRSHFEYLVKYANDIIFLIDENYGIVEANDRALETYGYKREEMLGLPLTALVAPEDLPSYKTRLRKIQQKGMIVAEAIHQRKNGSTFPVEVSARTIKIEDKPYIQEIIRDITERKQAEDKIQHFNLVLRAIRNVNQLIARGADRDTLLKGACENFVNTRGYYNAWIALLDESGKLVTAAEAGLGKKFRQMIERLKRGELPYCGREVLKKTGVVVIEDPASECVDCTLAKDYPGRCGMSVRLEYGGKVYGLMTVSAPSGIAGEKEELDLFEEVAGDISFALYSMEQKEERKKVEAEYQTIIRTAMDGFWLTDMQGHFLDVNEAYCRLIGYSRGELLNMSISDIEAIEELEDIAKRIRKIKKVGYDRFETRHRRKDGEIVDVEVSVNYLSTDGGRLFVFLRDITERKRVGEALAGEAIRRRILIEQSRDGIVVLDENGKVYEVNQRFAQMLGYSLEEARELHVWDWEFQFPREQVQEMIRSVDEKGDHFETRHRRKDGTTYDVEISTNGAMFMGHKLIFCVCRDITERKQAEEALRRSEQNFRDSIENSPLGIRIFDKGGKTLYINRALLDIWGYSSIEELEAVPRKQRYTPQSYAEQMERLAKRKRGEEAPLSYEVSIVRSDGQVRLLSASRGELLWNGENQFQILYQDITEYKKTEDEKRQLEQKAQIASRLASVGEMAAGIAHEINNPLTGVIGYAQLLVDREDVPSDIRRDLAAIDDGAQRVAGIVSRLLTFSRQTKLERRLVDINELIESTLALRDYHLRVNNIKVVTRLAPNLPETVADPGQLQQVFLNLIVNAETEMKLAHDKGRLTVTTEKSGKTIKIYFKDNGPGIKPELMNRIFDPFFTTREVGQGTGLGLSLSYGIVAEHKGKIYAESKPGKGATFVVELPIVTGVELLLKPPEPVVEEPENAIKAKILVVDDEQVVRDLVKRVLAGEGYEVDTVDNADDALKEIEGKRYNLILLDVKMPGISGVELYGSIQKIARSLARRVVFITGDVMAADTEKFLSETKVPHIAKPFNAEQLRREVKRALTGGR